MQVPLDFGVGWRYVETFSIHGQCRSANNITAYHFRKVGHAPEGQIYNGVIHTTFNICIIPP